MADSNTSPEMSSRIPLLLALIALAVVGFTLAGMAGGLVGALVVVFTVFSVAALLGAFEKAGPATTEEN